MLWIAKQDWKDESGEELQSIWSKDGMKDKKESESKVGYRLPCSPPLAESQYPIFFIPF